MVDFFYLPFRRVMSLQTFRYAASGSFNTLVGLVIYFVSYRIVLKEQNLNLGFFEFKSHVAALFMATCVSLPLGFFLMKYVVFSDSNMKGRIQLFRYFMIYLFNLVLNYLLLKVFVEILGIYPVLAQVLTTIITIFFSYIAQRNFTFKIKNAEQDIID